MDEALYIYHHFYPSLFVYCVLFGTPFLHLFSFLMIVLLRMYAHRTANRFVQASIDITYAGDLTVLSCAEIQCAKCVHILLSKTKTEEVDTAVLL